MKERKNKIQIIRAALLKSIWYAFTSLDTEDSGKVSKSQLKVLSHNLHSVLRIPHDPAALERHFSDDDDGPVSTQGYMPYLNQFILDKAEYLLRKISSVMPVELTCVELEEFLSQDAVQKDGLSVWNFLDVVNSAAVSRGVDGESISVAVEKVYREMVGNVLKEGYLWKKGHLRRNWTERWFCLKPGSLSYFVSEDCKDCKGVIEMDQNCCVEVLSDRDGKRCMFCVKTLNKTFEISAPDSRQRQEWITAIQTALRLSAEGRVSLHEELKARRRELREERERRRAMRAEETRRLRELQGEREEQLAELELLKEAQRQARARANLRAEVAEEEKVKSLLALQEEQEEQLQQTQREKQELMQEMERKSQALDDAQLQLDRVRASRRRVDQDIAAAQRKLRQASTSVKHWNVQMNRLMHPIGPGERRASSSNLLAPPVRNPSVSETESRPPPKPEREKQNSLHYDDTSGGENMDCGNSENAQPNDAE
ncbi:hypothetical protein H4Q32_026257 [Labeo rohita]|uniref:PH domain-containing protein n=1 Tax=Labeo rohita TaxID=84645 RepID=A0ABQ8L0X3_LABRO|nr:hypothetical protein H4Q32_026257 [Labeo rohita]